MASSSALSLACAASASFSRAAIGFRYSTEIIVKSLNNYGIFNWLNSELSPCISICCVFYPNLQKLGAILGITVPKFAISQSEANSTVLISYDIKSLTWFCYHNAKFWAEFGYGKYLIVSFWYASAAYQACLVSPWVFWLDCVSLKYEPWLDQTRLICCRSVPKRYD